jgi:glutamate racemase
MKIRIWLSVLTAFAWASVRADEAAKAAAPGPLTPLIEHVGAHQDGQVVNSIDFAALKGDRSGLPIGVFDSGIGGLTVLEAILKLDAFHNETLQPGADGVPDFAGEKFLYLGDQANMPYGNYPSKGKEDFLRELIVKDAVFLLGKRYHGAEGPRFDKPPVKAIVIACNTATAYGIEDIRAALKTWGLGDVPVIGVVEAGARAVVEQLPKEGPMLTVGVLATVGTCSSNAYPKAIERGAGLAGKPVPTVVQQGSVGLAGAIEGNPAFVWTGAGDRPVPYAGPKTGNSTQALNSVEEYAAFDASKLVSNAGTFRRSAAASLDMVILGCTHFPLVEREIDQALDESVKSGRLAPGKRLFINPAEHTAKELFRELARARLRNKADVTKVMIPGAEFFLSVANPSVEGVKLAADGSLETAYKEGRDTGRPEREDTKVIVLTSETLPASSRELFTKLPAVWAQMGRVQVKTTSAAERGEIPNRFRKLQGSRLGLGQHGPNCQCPRHAAAAEKLNPKPFGE